MKKFLKIGVFIMLLFSITACFDEEEAEVVIPEILLGSDTIELSVGDTIDLDSNLSSALLDGEDVSASIQVSHNIPMNGNMVTEMGAYDVYYTLDVEGVSYSSSCVVLVTEEYEVDYDVLVTKRSFTSEDGEGKFYLNVNYTGLSSADESGITVDFTCADYPSASVSSLSVSDEEVLSLVIDLGADWENTNHSYSISIKSNGSTVYSNTVTVTLVPTLTLSKTSLTFNLGDTINLSSYVKSALFDNGTSATAEVTYLVYDAENNTSEEIDTSAVGKYTVVYTLDERGTVVTQSLTVAVYDPDALVQIPTLTGDITYADDITSDTAQMVDIEFTTNGNEIISYINETVDGSSLSTIRFVVDYTYSFYASYQDAAGNTVVDESAFYSVVVSPLNTTFTAILAAVNVEKAARDYMFENGLDEMSVLGYVQLTVSTKTTYAAIVAKLENSEVMPITGEWILNTEVSTVTLPTASSMIYRCTANSYFLTFDLANVSQQIRNAFGLSYDELVGQIEYQYVFTNNITGEVFYTENRPVNETTKDTTTLTSAYIQTNTISPMLEAYMSDNNLEFVDYGFTVQAVKADTFNLDFEVVEGGLAELNSTIGTTPTYSNSLTFGENIGYGAWANVDPGQQAVWYDGAATMVASNTVDADGNTTTTVVGTQSDTGSWFQNQYFIESSPVKYSGTYVDVITITMNVTADIMIIVMQNGKTSNLAHSIEANVPYELTITNDFDKGDVNYLRMQFGTSTGGASGSFIATITGTHYKATTPDKLTVVSDTVTVNSGITTTAVQTALANNIALALDNYGSDISDKVTYLTATELAVDSDGKVVAGTYNVVYSVTMNSVTLEVSVTLVIV